MSASRTLEDLVVRLPLDDDIVEALRAEAKSQWPARIRLTSDQSRLENGFLRSPRRFDAAVAGELLNALHEGPWRSFLMNTYGPLVYPTRSSYIYYGPGDYVGPHHDVSQCEITGLISLGGEASTLTYPDLDLDGLDLEAFHTAFLDGTVEREDRIRLPASTVTFIPGTQLLHARRPAAHEAITLAACYIRA